MGIVRLQAGGERSLRMSLSLGSGSSGISDFWVTLSELCELCEGFDSSPIGAPEMVVGLEGAMNDSDRLNNLHQILDHLVTLMKIGFIWHKVRMRDSARKTHCLSSSGDQHCSTSNGKSESESTSNKVGPRQRPDRAKNKMPSDDWCKETKHDAQPFFQRDMRIFCRK